MAKDDKKVNKGKLHDTDTLNTIIDKLIMSLDDNYVSTLNLTEKNTEFKSIINDELNMSKGISHNNILDFTRSLSANNNNRGISSTTKGTDEDELYKYIAQNSGAIYSTYNERYKNRFIEAKDLTFITKMVPSLSQAIKITLDHITSSDDLSGAFSRSLDFGTNLEPESERVITQAIEQFETDTKLLYKMKNSCYKNCLITGKYYIYAVSYSKLFTEYSKNRAKLSQFGNAAIKDGVKNEFVSEGVTYDHVDTEVGCIAATCALEAAETKEISSMMSSAIPGKTVENPSMMAIREGVVNGIADVYTLDSSIPSEILEGMVGIEATMDKDPGKAGDMFREKVALTEKKNKDKNYANIASDGTVVKEAKGEKFDVTGTFMKFIKADKIIPIKVLDEVIGYLYVESKAKLKNSDAGRFINGEFTNFHKEDVIEKVARMLSDKIITKFSAKFVAENISFKNLIANCIMANGIVNTEYKIQFISSDDLFPFSINVDEDGEGQSILKNAIFPAKLLTSYTVKKNLNYINKSGDKTVAHIRSGQTDLSRKNQTMRIIRNLQESQITFGDMMADYSMMFHKYASDGNIVMPMGRNGNRLIEFEKMDGQNIDMNTEYEKNLENQALTATSVPPLLIEQYNQADFSKAYTTAHLGFAGTIASLQSDFEEGTTALYKRIIENLDINDSIKQQVLPTFKFKLPRPKSLSVLNNTESMSNAMSIADSMIQLKYGENQDDSKKELVNLVRFAIVKSMTPFIDWNEYEEIIQETEAAYDNISSKTSSSDSDMAGPSEF